MQPPRQIGKCFDDEKWEIDVTSLLKLDFCKSNKGGQQDGFISCKQNSIKWRQSDDANKET